MTTAPTRHRSLLPANTGVLTVTCLLGKPPVGAEEGIKLVVQDTPFNFNKPVEGETLFVRS